MGKFKPGEGGRPKGKPNKVTVDLRQWITSFIEDNRDQLKEDWQKLEPKERVIVFEKLLKYTLPTLQAISTNIEFERLPEEQLDEIIEKLKSQ